MSANDEKQQGKVARFFEDISRPLGAVGLFALTGAHAFLGVNVHDVAWYSFGALIVGKNLVEVFGGVADKIIAAMEAVKK